jgi:hypothetical protein
LTTLAALISGIVGSERTQLPHIARQVPDGKKQESRVKRFARWIANEAIEPERYFLPFADVLLHQLALPTLVLVIDGSVVGRGCIALLVNVIYQGRALPLAWTVVRGKKGHLPEALHLTLLEEVEALVPQGAQVVLLGDGECDGITLQQTLAAYGWT